jgi:3-deoxy-D-manno-octulosonic-acid transferase
MAARNSALSFLISTGTRTSADLVAKRAGPRATHVYAPVDSPDAVRRFLDCWKPDLGVFVESEVWPNLILEAQRRAIPLALVNARMSPATSARWRQWKSAGKRVFGAFSAAFAADKRTSETLSALRGEPAPVFGNLKLAAAPPTIDENAVMALEAEIRDRDVWLAASTHVGEEEILLAAHEILRAKRPDALLIIVPRHPERGAAVAALKHSPRRALQQSIGQASVYIADTLGELGVFYATATAAFVAGSLLPALKGHNPIEPVKLGAPVIAGPYVESFADAYDALYAADAALRAKDASEIAAAVETLWGDTDLALSKTEKAKAVFAVGDEALMATIDRLFALLPATPERVAPKPKAADASA